MLMGMIQEKGENWRSSIYTKLYFALERARRMGDFYFLLCAFPYFPNYLP